MILRIYTSNNLVTIMKMNLLCVFELKKAVYYEYISGGMKELCLLKDFLSYLIYFLQLESVYRGNFIRGSNPLLSAKLV